MKNSALSHPGKRKISRYSFQRSCFAGIITLQIISWKKQENNPKVLMNINVSGDHVISSRYSLMVYFTIFICARGIKLKRLFVVES